jgi:hypothetical protein
MSGGRHPRIGISWAPAEDPDANAWIAAVEAADGQALEATVKTAMNTLITGIKTDGDWAQVAGLNVLNAARTLNGAANAIKGPNIVSFLNIVQADLTRGLGIQADGTTKFIDAGVQQNTFIGASSGNAGIHFTSWTLAPSGSMIGWHTTNAIRLDMGGTTPVGPSTTGAALAGNIGSSAYLAGAGIPSPGFGVNLIVSSARQDASNVIFRSHPPTPAVSTTRTSAGSAGGTSSTTLMSATIGGAAFFNGRVASYVFGSGGPASINRVMPRLATFTATLRTFFGN